MTSRIKSFCAALPHLLLHSHIARSARKYFVAGGLCTIVDWGVFAALLYELHIHYLICGTISFLLATALNYFLSVRYVFGTARHSASRTVALIYIASAVGLAFNLGILSICIATFGLNAMLAKIIATGIVFAWNFSARYFYVFDR